MEISLAIAIFSLVWAIFWGIFTYNKQHRNRELPSDLESDTEQKDKSFSKDKPIIWSVPYPKNLHFSGRKELLSLLRATFISKRTHNIPQAICGLGGMGKTQLALEYIYQYKNEYNAVFWINAQDPTTIDNSYAGLRQLLELKIKPNADQYLIKEKIREWFRFNEKWLLVFDNVEHPKDIIEYLPQEHTGSIIITTRNPNLREIANTVKIPTWSIEESVSFLQSRTGKNDKINAKKIAKALGGLPLALAQAAAYIDSKQKTFSEYLELFSNQRQALWGKEVSPLDYEKTVSTTWELAIARVKNEAQAGAKILNLCVYLAPDNIPRSFIGAIANHLEETEFDLKDVISIDHGIGTLNRYSLINSSEDTLSLHRLVQLVARDNLPISDQKKCCKAAINLIEHKFPKNALRNVKCWPECNSLLGHAHATVNHAIGLSVAVNEVNNLLDKMGSFLYGRRADYSEVVQSYINFIKLLKSSPDSDLEHLALSYNNLGELLSDQGDFSKSGTASTPIPKYTGKIRYILLKRGSNFT